jgi:translation initiation factor 1A
LEQVITRELEFKQENEDYAIIINILGHGKSRIKCFSDETEHIAFIRGKLFKVRFDKDDIVLVGIENNFYGIIHKYLPEEIQLLKSYGEIDQIKQEQQENSDGEIEDEINIDWI